MAKGPIGNAPRDLRDEFVGDDVLYKGGEPPKKTRGRKRVTSNTFHSKVTGETSNKRPDRAGHFRSGGFVRPKTGADAGDMKAGFPKGPRNKKLLADAKGVPTTNPVVPKRIGSIVKKADGGTIAPNRVAPAVPPMPQVKPTALPSGVGVAVPPMPQVKPTGLPSGLGGGDSSTAMPAMLDAGQPQSAMQAWGELEGGQALPPMPEQGGGPQPPMPALKKGGKV